MLHRSGGSLHYDRGIRFFDQGLYKDAIDEFKLALAESHHGDLTERLARFYLAESYSALALNQIANNAQGEAVENLQSAIALSPNFADLHYHLAVAYLARNEPQAARIAIEQAIQINPSYARAYLVYGVILCHLNEREAGLHQAKKAVQFDASFDTKYLDEAQKAHAKGDTKAVIVALNRMNRTQGDEAIHYARLGLDFFRKGMFEEAIEEYRQALSIAPNYADLRNQLGIVLFAARRDEEAIVEFARATTINPRYIEAHLNQALALQRMERGDEAHASFARVLELDPDNQIAREGLQKSVSPLQNMK